MVTFLESLYQWSVVSPDHLFIAVVAIATIISGFGTLWNARLTKRIMERQFRPYVEVQVWNTPDPCIMRIFTIVHSTVPATIYKKKVRIIWNEAEFHTVAGLKKDSKLGSTKFQRIASMKDNAIIFPSYDPKSQKCFTLNISDMITATEATIAKPFISYVIKISYKGSGAKRYYYTSVHENKSNTNEVPYTVMWASDKWYKRYSHKKLKVKTVRALAK